MVWDTRVSARGSTDVIMGDSWGCPVSTRQQGTNIGGRVQAASVDWCGGDSFGRVRALCDVSKGFWQYMSFK